MTADRPPAVEIECALSVSRAPSDYSLDTLEIAAATLRRVEGDEAAFGVWAIERQRARWLGGVWTTAPFQESKP